MAETSIQWTNIAGWPGYRVSRGGAVESCWSTGGRTRRLTDTWRMLPTLQSKRGHLRVALYGHGRRGKLLVHRLVLEAFVGPCPPGMEGCHNDGDPTNNRLENLRWDTPKANWEDRRRHGRANAGEDNAAAKLTAVQVREIRALRRDGLRLREIAPRFGVTMAMVSKIARGEAWNGV
ncbi:HNH endonuclease [Sorangium sp. So ce1024]|uniref:HNH endonuclease n=1 Tax=Sorangium sp. So ce1024 TaxID=3133327 RepID=UPI003F0DD0DD